MGPSGLVLRNPLLQRRKKGGCDVRISGRGTGGTANRPQTDPRTGGAAVRHWNAAGLRRPGAAHPGAVPSGGPAGNPAGNPSSGAAAASVRQRISGHAPGAAGTMRPRQLCGRAASVLYSCGDTAFYIIPVYCAAAKVTNSRQALPAALLGSLAGTVCSVLSVRLFFG